MIIQIDNIKENKDGTAILDVSFDNVFRNFVLKYYGKKKLTKTLLQKFIIEGLENYIERRKKNA